MLTTFEILASFESFIPLITTIIVLIIVFIVLRTVISLGKKRLLLKATTKKQITNIELFSRILKYLIFLLLIIFAIFSYSGSWTGLGLGIGLFSAAIGFALQRPITGIVAWLVVVTRRPFEIGDRILIGNVKGDVTDIALTHIYLSEVGGIISAEENSGRIIMIPNSVLFEQNIINYSIQKEEIVLDEVMASVTYESNLEKAMEISLLATKKYVDEFVKKPRKEPYVRVFFQPSGINVHARYFVPIKKMQSTASNITKEIYEQIIKARDVEFAYPHTEFVIKDKNAAQRWQHKTLGEYSVSENEIKK